MLLLNFIFNLVGRFGNLLESKPQVGYLVAVAQTGVVVATWREHVEFILTVCSLAISSLVGLLTLSLQLRKWNKKDSSDQ